MSKFRLSFPEVKIGKHFKEWGEAIRYCFSDAWKISNTIFQSYHPIAYYTANEHPELLEGLNLEPSSKTGKYARYGWAFIFSLPKLLLWKPIRWATRALGFSSVAKKTAKKTVKNVYYMLFGADFSAALSNLVIEPLSAGCEAFNAERFNRSPFSAFFDAIGLIPALTLTFVFAILPMLLLKGFRLLTRLLGVSEQGFQATKLFIQNVYYSLFGDKNNENHKIIKKNLSEILSYQDGYRKKRSPLSASADHFGVSIPLVLIGLPVSIFLSVIKIFRLATRLIGVSLKSILCAHEICVYLYHLFFGNLFLNDCNQQYLKPIKLKLAPWENQNKNRFKRSPLSTITDIFGAALLTTLNAACISVLFVPIKIISLAVGLLGFSKQGLKAAFLALRHLYAKMYQEPKDANTQKKLLVLQLKPKDIEKYPVTARFNCVGAYLLSGLTYGFFGITLGLVKALRLITRVLGFSKAGFYTIKQAAQPFYRKLFDNDSNIVNDQAEGVYLKELLIGEDGKRSERSPWSAKADALGCKWLKVITKYLGAPIFLITFKVGRLISRVLGFSELNKNYLKSSSSFLFNLFFGSVEEHQNAWIALKEQLAFDKERFGRSPLSMIMDYVGVGLTSLVLGSTLLPVLFVMKIVNLTFALVGLSLHGFYRADQVMTWMYYRLFGTKSELDKAMDTINVEPSMNFKEMFAKYPLYTLLTRLGGILTGTLAGVLGALVMVPTKILRLFTRVLGFSQMGILACAQADWNIYLSLFSSSQFKAADHSKNSEENATIEDDELSQAKKLTKQFEELINDKERKENYPASYWADRIGVWTSRMFTYGLGLPVALMFKACRLVTRSIGFSEVATRTIGLITCWVSKFITKKNYELEENCLYLVRKGFSSERWKRSPLSTFTDAIGVVLVTPIAAAFAIVGITIAQIFGLRQICKTRLVFECKEILNIFKDKSIEFETQKEKNELKGLSDIQNALSYLNIPFLVFKTATLIVGILARVFMGVGRLVYRATRGLISTVSFGNFWKSPYHADYSDEAKNNPLNKIVILRNSLNIDGSFLKEDGLLNTEGYTKHLECGLFGRLWQGLKFEFGKVMRLGTNSIDEDLIDAIEKYYKAAPLQEPTFRNSTFFTQCKENYAGFDLDRTLDNRAMELESFVKDNVNKFRS